MLGIWNAGVRNHPVWENFSTRDKYKIKFMHRKDLSHLYWICPSIVPRLLKQFTRMFALLGNQLWIGEPGFTIALPFFESQPFLSWIQPSITEFQLLIFCYTSQFFKIPPFNPEDVTCELNSCIAILCNSEIPHLSEIRELGLPDVLCWVVMLICSPKFLCHFASFFLPFSENGWLTRMLQLWYLGHIKNGAQ